MLTIDAKMLDFAIDEVSWTKISNNFLFLVSLIHVYILVFHFMAVVVISACFCQVKGKPVKRSLPCLFFLKCSCTT